VCQWCALVTPSLVSIVSIVSHVCLSVADSDSLGPIHAPMFSLSSFLAPALVLPTRAGPDPDRLWALLALGAQIRIPDIKTLESHEPLSAPNKGNSFNDTPYFQQPIYWLYPSSHGPLLPSMQSLLVSNLFPQLCVLGTSFKYGVYQLGHGP
jgi:hypothetical protein